MNNLDLYDSLSVAKPEKKFVSKDLLETGINTLAVISPPSESDRSSIRSAQAVLEKIYRGENNATWDRILRVYPPRITNG